MFNPIYLKDDKPPKAIANQAQAMVSSKINKKNMIVNLFTRI